MIGRDPEGRVHRLKVLSSACLRAEVSEVPSARSFRLALPSSLPALNLRGFQYRRPDDDPDRVYPILDYRREEQRVETAEDHGLSNGNTIELFTGDESPVFGARLMTGVAGDERLPRIDMRLGTTRGTNALLERKGAPVLLLVSKGFRDLLLIGDQRRPELFALEIEKPLPLFARVIEVEGRLSSQGEELESIVVDEALEKRIREAIDDGCCSVAIALLNSYSNPSHEHEVETRLAEMGLASIVRSSELAPVIKLLARAQTTVMEAYLGPILGRYLDKVEEALEGGRLRVMTSAGGLMDRSRFRAKDGLLSGPAGGVVGAAAIGARAGYKRIIAFDMGGTSTDVSRSEGSFEYRPIHEIGGARVVAPALRIETVAAGGGSICSWDGRRLLVGPDSAGADPGPACYGAGGPLTLTDVNLLLGRLQPSAFSIPVQREEAEARADEMAEACGMAREAMLSGLARIANERMAAAIRKISVREGYDPKDYALVAFGGAGGVHACAIADELGLQTVCCPRDAGILSASGIMEASIERIRRREVLAPLDEVEKDLTLYFEELGQSAGDDLCAEGLEPGEITTRFRRVALRFAGQESTLTVDWTTDDLAAVFEREYRSQFGYFPENRRLEVESIEVAVSSREQEREDEWFAAEPKRKWKPDGSQQILAGERWVSALGMSRKGLEPGDEISGPAVVYDELGTLVIDEGWRGEVGSGGTIRLSRVQSVAKSEVEEAMKAPATLELYVNRFRQVVEEMGEQLARTAISTNVKERMDFSCALLDGQGRLITNAPHIPVHLGSLGVCTRSVAKAIRMEAGDVAVTNHPANGGSHLPDITVITPVFWREELVAYVANRAHHAELGGILPGSMPPKAAGLAEEGVVIEPTYLFKGGDARWTQMREILQSGSYPTRGLDENLADLNAQVAANRLGSELVRSLLDRFGRKEVLTHMEELLRFSSAVLVEEMGKRDLSYGECRTELDDGTPLRVSVRFADARIHVDFTGSADSHPGSMNATEAIVRSAVVYVLRLLIREDLPLNEGLMDPVELILPRCFLNPDFTGAPQEAPAVVGGNVETSQRVVEMLLRTLGVMADSQGTMNNVIFGNDDFSYYETIGGGAGAGPDFHGASGVHTHMTNTAITDPEVLEFRYPVRLRRFEMRPGSGGKGKWCGGDGLVRELEFVRPVTVSLLTQHRREGPSGAEGGESGQPGKQERVKTDGSVVELPAVVDYEAEAGERLIVQTPGGGGWGQVS